MRRTVLIRWIARRGWKMQDISKNRVKSIVSIGVAVICLAYIGYYFIFNKVLENTWLEIVKLVILNVSMVTVGLLAEDKVRIKDLINVKVVMVYLFINMIALAMILS